MATIGSLVVSLTAEVARFSSDLARARTDLAGVSKSVGDTNKSLNGFGSTVRKVGGLLAAAFAVQQVVQYADAWQLAGNKIAAVTGQSAEQLNATREAIFQVAQETRSSFDATATLFARLTGASKEFGATQEQVLQVTETVQKALAAGGATTTEAAAAALQLSQALGSGVLQGDELRSILENSRGLAEAIAKHFGVSVGELKKMGEGGVLVADEVFKALLEAGKATDEQFGRTKSTVGQAIATLENAFQKLVGTFAEQSGLIETLSSLLMTLGEALGLVGTALGPVLELLKPFFEFLSKLIGATNLWIKSGQALRDVMMVIGPAIEAVTQAWKFFEAAAISAWTAIQTTAQPVIDWLLVAIENVRVAIASVMTFINDMIAAAESVAATVSSVFESAPSALTAEAGGISLGERLRPFGVTAAAGGALQAPNVDQARKAAEEIATIFDQLSLAVQASVWTMRTNVGDAFREMRGVSLEEAQALADLLVGHSIIPDMVTAVLGWFDRMAAGSKTALEKTSEGFETLRTAQSELGQTQRALDDGFDHFGQTLTSVADGFIDAASGARTWKDAALDALKAVGDELVRFLSKDNGKGSIFDDILGGVGDFFGSLFGGGSAPSGGSGTDFFPGFASGTASASPGWHMVGERGPEMMSFSGGEQVIPNHALGGGDTTVEVNVINTTGEPTDVRRSLDGKTFDISVGRAMASQFANNGPGSRAAQQAFNLTRAPGVAR